MTATLRQTTQGWEVVENATAETVAQAESCLEARREALRLGYKVTYVTQLAGGEKAQA